MNDPRTLDVLLTLSDAELRNYLLRGLSRSYHKTEQEPFEDLPIRPLQIEDDFADLVALANSYEPELTERVRRSLADIVSKRIEISPVGIYILRTIVAIGSAINSSEIALSCLELLCEQQWIETERKRISLGQKSEVFAPVGALCFALQRRDEKIAKQLERTYQTYGFMTDYAPLFFSALIRHAPSEVVKHLRSMGPMLSKHSELRTTSRRVAQHVPIKELADNFFSMCYYSIEHDAAHLIQSLLTGDDALLELHYAYAVKATASGEEGVYSLHRRDELAKENIPLPTKSDLEAFGFSEVIEDKVYALFDECKRWNTPQLKVVS